MQHTEFLEKLGLSSRESTVYLALLLHGAMGVSDISRKSELYRTDVYQAIASLSREGLVIAQPKGKYKVYKAAPPEVLEKKFLELANVFDERIALLASLAPERHSKRPEVTYVEGKKAIAAVYDDIVTTLSKGDVYYRYSSAKVTGEDKRNNYLSKKYRLLRDQKQIERKVITNAANTASKKPRLEREIKTIPPDFDLFEYNVSQVIYGDKVAVIDYNTETVVVIDNPTIARFQQKIFELLFRKL